MAEPLPLKAAAPGARENRVSLSAAQAGKGREDDPLEAVGRAAVRSRKRVVYCGEKPCQETFRRNSPLPGRPVVGRVGPGRGDPLPTDRPRPGSTRPGPRPPGKARRPCPGPGPDRSPGKTARPTRGPRPGTKPLGAKGGRGAPVEIAEHPGRVGAGPAQAEPAGMRLSRKTSRAGEYPSRPHRPGRPGPRVVRAGKGRVGTAHDLFPRSGEAPDREAVGRFGQGEKKRLQVVVAVGPAAEDAQVQVDLARRGEDRFLYRSGGVGHGVIPDAKTRTGGRPVPRRPKRIISRPPPDGAEEVLALPLDQGA
jgi:hypothetical protein